MLHELQKKWLHFVFKHGLHFSWWTWQIDDKLVLWPNDDASWRRAVGVIQDDGRSWKHRLLLIPILHGSCIVSKIGFNDFVRGFMKNQLL